MKIDWPSSYHDIIITCHWRNIFSFQISIQTWQWPCGDQGETQSRNWPRDLTITLQSWWNDWISITNSFIIKPRPLHHSETGTAVVRTSQWIKTVSTQSWIITWQMWILQAYQMWNIFAKFLAWILCAAGENCTQQSDENLPISCGLTPGCYQGTLLSIKTQILCSSVIKSDSESCSLWHTEAWQAVTC